MSEQPTIIATDEEAHEDNNCHIGVTETSYGWLVAHYFRWSDTGSWQRDVSGKILLTASQVDKLHAAVHREDDLCSLRAVCEAVAQEPYPDSDLASLLETLRCQAKAALEK